MRRSNPRQLSFGFADSPQGGGTEGHRGVSPERDALLQRAKSKTATRFASCAGTEGGLLEQVASEQNLARALLNVVRNKGAPGVDGQTVGKAEADASRLLSGLRGTLLDGSYRPGAIRRVMIPKAPFDRLRRRGAPARHPQRPGPGGATGAAPGSGAGVRAPLPCQQPRLPAAAGRADGHCRGEAAPGSGTHRHGRSGPGANSSIGSIISAFWPAWAGG